MGDLERGRLFCGFAPDLFLSYAYCMLLLLQGQVFITTNLK
jgi:hypothetical protein